MFWKSREKIKEEDEIQKEKINKFREEEFQKREEKIIYHFQTLKDKLENPYEQQLALESFILGINACLEAGFVYPNKTVFVVEKVTLENSNIEENE